MIQKVTLGIKLIHLANLSWTKTMYPGTHRLWPIQVMHLTIILSRVLQRHSWYLSIKRIWLFFYFMKRIIHDIFPVIKYCWCQLVIISLVIFVFFHFRRLCCKQKIPGLFLTDNIFNSLIEYALLTHYYVNILIYVSREWMVWP